MADKKYYWLKLKRDFFKRHDIRIIESMPNGKEYILFYLKLLCESVDHEGNLRFSENIPYNEDMLATITNTNVDIVRMAIKVFQELNMMEVLDNGTYFMQEVEKMMGSETYWAEQKRKQRRQIQDNVETMSNKYPTCPSKSKRIDKDTDIDKEKEHKKKAYSPDATLDSWIVEFIKHRKTLKRPMSDKAIELFVNRLQKLCPDNIGGQIEMIKTAIESGWLTVYSNFDKKPMRNNKSKLQALEDEALGGE